MTLRLSTGARNKMLNASGFSGLFNKGSINIYSGSQPATADAAPTGTLLGIVTVGSGALTQETQATGTIVITAAASGSVGSITVGTFNIIPDGAVNAVAGDTAATAVALAAAINRCGIFSATVSGSTVTIKPRPGSGAAYNGLALTGSLTTVTATYGGGTVSGGVAAANGLTFADPATGVLGKPAATAWSFAGVAAGTAGWFRFIGSALDDNSLSTTNVRLDGSIATSGGDMGLSNISVAVSAPNTVDRFNVTQPAQ